MTKRESISIDGREIGPALSPYVIAELSANHNGNIEKAIETISMAKKMGADAVKIQSYTPDSMTIKSDKKDFKINGGLWDGYSLYELYDIAKTPYEWIPILFDHAKKENITCFSTPFDEEAVNILEHYGAPAYKIASFEIIDIPLVRYAAKTGKPIIISTGMANLQEISEVVEIVKKVGNDNVILLHCISGYPTPVNQSNLLNIMDLVKRFGLLVGLSDHTVGTTVAIASVALGACVIEKHVTLSRNDSGPDSAFSIEPDELKQLCEDVNVAWSALGTPGYGLKPIEVDNIKFRRSIYAVKDIKAGDALSPCNIKRIRPGYGLPPKYFYEIIGKRAKVGIEKGTALSWHHIDDMMVTP